MYDMRLQLAKMRQDELIAEARNARLGRARRTAPLARLNLTRRPHRLSLREARTAER